MKVLQTGIMPNGTNIQIEDWSEEYPSRPYTIGSYPISKKSHKGPFSPKEDEKYRFQFSFDTLEQIEGDFEKLIKGEKELIDLKERFSSKKEYLDCI